MKAIICTKYGPPSVLEFRDVPKPYAKSNEVCVRVYAVSVTVSDCNIRGFNISAALRLPMAIVIGFHRPRKSILGMVFAGEVESVGEHVKSFKLKDKVFGFDRFSFGTYAQYKCISEKGLIAPLPGNMGYTDAAAIPYGGLIALSYLRTGNAQGRRQVLIYGASGSVGTAAVQLSKHFGAEVTGVCSGANAELVKSLGADAVFDYTKDEKQVIGTSFDLILDAVGKRKDSKLKAELAQAYKSKYLSVDDGSPKMSVRDLMLLKELAELGKLRPVIDRSYRLDQMSEAHAYVENGHKRGNVIVTVE